MCKLADGALLEVVESADTQLVEDVIGRPANPQDRAASVPV